MFLADREIIEQNITVLAQTNNKIAQILADTLKLLYTNVDKLNTNIDEINTQLASIEDTIEDACNRYVNKTYDDLSDRVKEIEKKI